MEWLKEWAKPAVIIVAIGIFATCGNNHLNQRFDRIDSRFDRMENRIDSRFDRMENRIAGIDSRLQVIEERTFEMNTRLSRIEGKLDISDSLSVNELPPEDTEH